jgi:hypothetical protein
MYKRQHRSVAKAGTPGLPVVSALFRGVTAKPSHDVDTHSTTQFVDKIIYSALKTGVLTAYDYLLDSCYS